MWPLLTLSSVKFVELYVRQVTPNTRGVGWMVNCLGLK